MARVNCGINPYYLSDQHLRAESVELTMISGSLRSNNYQIKGQVPSEFCLGSGHINFFKPKLIYLKTRLEEVNEEMKRRSFKCSTEIDLLEFQNNGCKCLTWQPKFKDSCLVRERVVNRLTSPLKAKIGFHTYYNNPIENIQEFINNIKNSKLYYV